MRADIDAHRAAQLAEGLQAMGLTVEPGRQLQLLSFCDLMARWNTTFNLSAIRDPADMVSAHLLDSLAALPHLPETSTLLDVGSGAGVPGVPLAIARPGLALTSIEAVGKKAAFQQQAVSQLGLANVRVIHGRIETHAPATGYQRIICRAFSDLGTWLRLTLKLLSEGGQWLAYKADLTAHERDALPPGVRVIADIPLRIPGISAPRRLLTLERA